ncbi:MAG: amino acid permease [Cytophagaceae bacterium]|jgi:amino acid transporter|nr:amino acid permease [Cytophagaceae bacterium]
MKNSNPPLSKGFGTAPVYFTAVSTILGAILFLRFGTATGILGFWGAIAIIIVGHLITIPTALAISEIATNTRVEGGGEYFIISRSFGLKIGSTIGMALYFSQAISVAFYIVAFAESFHFLFEWFALRIGFELPRQVISMPALFIFAFFILRKGVGSGMKMLYFVVGVLLVSLLFFFMGSPIEAGENATRIPGNNFGFFNGDSFFMMLAICFPAFTGMTAGVGLSGDLRNPGKSIPIGTMAATLTGLIVYLLVVGKLAVSASQIDLVNNQLIMADIAVFGTVIIPLGLAASTLSSAMGSFLVAPRTLQALAMDKSFPLRRMNIFFAKGKGKNREPFNASIATLAIAAIFVLIGNVDTVAQIISMFFLITYGTLCLISFLNHFGSPPSYRPRFKSRWFLSLGGFVLSVWVMFMISPFYTILSYIIIIVIYLFVEHSNKNQKGVVNIFKGALFQLNRRLQVYMQKHRSDMDNEEWRPAAICISSHSLEREKVLDLMRWISYQHGFGTYFHFIEGYFSKQTHEESENKLRELIDSMKELESTLYIDTMISPSYTSAIAQVIQSPSISGMENNMVVFEYDKSSPEELHRILDNINLVRAGHFDICIFGNCIAPIKYRNGIHVWIKTNDEKNANFMILLGYIILAHPDWKKSYIKIFSISAAEQSDEVKRELEERIATGRLPITLANIEIITLTNNQTVGEIIAEHSKTAGLTIIGFHEDIINHGKTDFFSEFGGIGDVLFVNSYRSKAIN